MSQMPGGRRRNPGEQSVRPQLPLPAHPYRDTAILHGSLAAVLVLIAVVTGVNIGTALVVAPLYFVAATAWSWWRFSRRIRRAAVDAAEEASAGNVDGSG